MSNIIQKILDNPENYQQIINESSTDDRKELYKTYKSCHTDDNVEIMANCFTEEELKNKLLGCSQTIISILKMLDKK